MPEPAVATTIRILGGWLLAVPLGLALLTVIGAVLWFLRRSRGRRVVPADPADDPLER